MKKSSVIFGLLAVVVLVLSACGPAATVAPTAAPTIKVGMVTDTGGIDDKSFNNLSGKASSRGFPSWEFPVNISNHTSRLIMQRTSSS